MSEQHVEREAAEPAPDRLLLLGYLERARRMHDADDEQSFAAAAKGLIAYLLGSEPADLRITEPQRLEAAAGAGTGDELDEAASRAAREGLVVLDDRRGVAAFPVKAQNGGSTGVLVFWHPAGARLAGQALDIMRHAAAEIVLAKTGLDRRKTGVGPRLADVNSLHDAKLAFERQLLQLRLQESRGNVAAAARSLDMDRGQLSRLMKKHQLDRAAFRRPEVPEDGPTRQSG